MTFKRCDKHGGYGRPFDCDECSNLESSASPACSSALFLPKLDIDWMACCDGTPLIERDEKGFPQWSQLAVDFVCLLNVKCR